MVNWIKKYCVWIIVGLFALFMLQTCRSCTKANTLSWTEAETTAVIDSLEREVLVRDRQIDLLNAKISESETKISLQASTIESLKRDKEFLEQTNSKLNANLNKSLDKNDKSE